ncbi:MAG: H-X9-DG-CTERM domain-containing protein [Kiritimatiellia bacterium]|jgi:prepilin-type processing-associated H-X9-DG protein/prepilin-type N-terminal cleavage/methylation domain-containing protein
MKRRPAVASDSLRAFTLVEMLVVMGVVAVLVGMTTSTISAVRDAAKSAKCASNLSMMAKAALTYANDHHGQFPWASRRVKGEFVCWDFITGRDGSVRPGEMWDGYGIASVMQCPAYSDGKANWKDNPYTGYNYNCSYIGKVEGDPGRRTSPARLAQIQDPARTALFGDGQYGGGANKFMRAPVRQVAADGSGKSVRLAGTQGFRHRGKTNVAFCDGHVESLAQPYQYGGAEGFTAPNCGFLSPDNRLYSLEK